MKVKNCHSKIIGDNIMNKISIASRRKMHQTFPKPSGKKIVMIPQNLKTEDDAKFGATKFGATDKELVKLFSNVNKVLSEQKQIQFSVTLTQADAKVIKIDVNSQPNIDNNTILTSDEVCDMLKITKSFLYKYARMGVIPGLKIGCKWRFEADSIFKLFRET